MPRFSQRTLERLVAALDEADADAACLGDAGGQQQWLAGVYRYDALQAARPRERAEEHGLSMRRLVGPLRVSVVPASAEEALDVDTWEDLERVRTRRAD
jgi:CTP:molybdopterin cytidylyltransferase MocA